MKKKLKMLLIVIMVLGLLAGCSKGTMDKPGDNVKLPHDKQEGSIPTDKAVELSQVQEELEDLLKIIEEIDVLEDLSIDLDFEVDFEEINKELNDNN